jgi:hypothetical protein
MKKELQDWISLTKSKPTGALPSWEWKGKWMALKKPLSQWPKTLREKWEPELLFLFQTQEVKARDFLGDQRLCLCIDTLDCGEKKDHEENRGCLYYARGICLAATTLATGVPISFGVMGTFFGISKQRVQQIYVGAQKKVMKRIAADPFLKEICMGLGVGTKLLPSADELADDIDDLLKG